MPLTVEVVTAERIVRTEEGVDIVIAPATDGQLAILPRHAALMTTLGFGEMVFRRGSEEHSFVILGGFMEVQNDKVTILADQAETADEIDETRAEEARRRAEERLRRYRDRAESDVDYARAQASLQRALLRLNVTGKRRRRVGAPRV